MAICVAHISMTVLLLSTTPTSQSPEPLIEAKTVVTDLDVDLRYATPDNFMKKQVYPDGARCLLLRRSLEKLNAAAKVLRAKGFRLKAYDCYRPHSVQSELWKVMPVPGYVADPKTGSNHNRGGAIDLTLITLDGGDVEMPSPYDFFGKAAHQNFEGGTASSRANRKILRDAMEAAGFTTNPMEWWHYDLAEAKTFPLRDEPFTAPDAHAADAGR